MAYFWSYLEFLFNLFNYENYAKFVVFRHKLVSVMTFLTFDIDVQMPNVSYLIHNLSGDLDPGKI